MLEKEIKFISDFTLNLVKNFGQSFTFQKVAESGLHPSILKYIAAEIDYIIYEDRKKLLNKSPFNYSGSAISRYFSLIGEEIKKTQKISGEDFKKLINQAIAFNANFLMHPKTTLMKLMFDESEKIDIEELSLLFDHLYFYCHYKDIFLAYTSKKNILTVSAKEFEEILNKIDDELFKASQKATVENAIDSMGEFYSIGNPGSNKVPPAAVEAYLKEKKLKDYLNNLIVTVGDDSKQSYHISEIKSILFSIKTAAIQEEKIYKAEEPEDEIVIEEEPEKIEEDLEEKPEEKLEENIEEKSVENIEEDFDSKIDVKSSESETDKIIFEDEEEIDLPADEDEELYKKDIKYEQKKDEIKTDVDEVNFDISEKEHLDSLYEFDEDKEVGTKEEEKESVKKDLQDEEDEEPELTLDEEDSIDDFGKEEEKIEDKIELKDMDIKIEEVEDRKDIKPLKKRPISQGDLFTYLTDKEIEKIVSNVFNDDKDDFTNTIEHMMELDTYEEATEILKSVFLTYKINPYSRDAVVLTNAVAKYFFNP